MLAWVKNLIKSGSMVAAKAAETAAQSLVVSAAVAGAASLTYQYAENSGAPEAAQVEPVSPAPGKSRPEKGARAPASLPLPRPAAQSFPSSLENARSEAREGAAGKAVSQAASDSLPEPTLVGSGGSPVFARESSPNASSPQASTGSSAGVVSVGGSGSAATDTATSTETAAGSNAPSAPAALVWASPYSTSLSVLPELTWSDATDADGDLTGYEVALGTTSGAYDVVAWASVDNATQKTWSSLTLTDGVTYYGSVRAVDAAGNRGDAASTSVIVDLTAPAMVGVPAWANVTAGSTASSPALSWAATDAASGVSHYLVALGTTAGATDLVSWQISASAAYTFTGLSLAVGPSYYATVKAVDKAGHISTAANSVAFTVDPVVPNPPTAVLDGSITTSTSAGTTISWTASTSAAGANFTGYQVALGTSAGGTDILGWTSVGNVTSYTPNAGFTLIQGNVYFATVRALKNSGLTSAAANGDGFTVNTLTASLRCDFSTGTSTECYANPYPTIRRPVFRFNRAAGGSTHPGTYVDSAGVIRNAGTNMVLRSEEINNASWNASANVAVTADQAVAPDGTTTADYVSDTATNAYHYAGQNITGTNATSYCFSFYAKAGTATLGQIQLGGTGFSNQYALLDLTAGTITSVGNGAAIYGSTPAGNGWHRYHLCGTSVGTALAPLIMVRNAAGASTYNGAGNLGFYAWGAQLEAGTSPSSYANTQAAAGYLPRFDHDPTSCTAGVCVRRGLMIENTRRNYLTRSMDFATSWAAVATLVSADSAASPDGTNNADKLVEDVANSTHTMALNVGAQTLTNQWSFSVFLKAAERSAFRIRIFEGANSVQLNGDLSDLSTTTNVTGASTLTASGIHPYGNGWYRVWVSGIPNPGGTTGTIVGSIYVRKIGSGDSYTYAGDGTSGFYAWGAQMEQGALPSSFIPTTTSALTRNLDSMTATAISSWFPATEGSLWISARTPILAPNIAGHSQSAFECHDGTGTGDHRFMFRLRERASGQTQFTMNTAGVTPFSLRSTTVVAADSPATVAASFRLNDFAASAYGETRTVDTSGSLSTSNQCVIGGSYNTSENLLGHVRFLQLFDQRLSNSSLKYLSTP